MHHLLYADYFLTGSLLTIVLPIALLISLATWYVIAVRRVPEDTAQTSTTLPPPEVVEAAGPEVVGDVTPVEPSSGEPGRPS
ncbi:MAG TPA: hypothetical protein VKV21_16335 [Solirubrobacteraceae bacterium]|nr:hypothetical protein [Solirubrobacteraceae bacterium]